MTGRPNILCLVSEDCPPRLGAYGDTLAATPHIDALARNGVTFDAAFCTSPVCAPSRFAILTGRYGESSPPANQMTGFGPTPPGVLSYPEMMRAAGYYCTNNAKTHYNCDIDPAAIWNETSPVAHWRNRSPGQPFLAVFNCMDTHESCVFEDRPGAVSPEMVRLPAYLPDTDGMRRSLASHYNSIARMDQFMGDRLRELEGEADNTMVLFYSDHGSPLPRSKRFCYDEGLRVPLIVSVPARWRHLVPAVPGTRVSSPVSLIDLLPTFAAIAGCAAPEGIHGQPIFGAARRRLAFSGRDRMDERADMTRTVRSERHRYIRNYSPHRIWGQHYAFAWVSRAYQDFERLHLSGGLTAVQDRFWRQKPAEELYDLEADPDSTRNLVDSDEHQEVLIELRAALDAHMLRIHDCGFIPEGSAAEGWDVSRDPAVYPLPEVMALAARAIRRDPAEAAAFLEDLSHPSMVMRYWAAQGVLMLAVAGHPLPDGLAARLAAERDPHVRVPLAEALGHAGPPERQIALLVRIIDEEINPRLRLQALDALTNLPLRPAIAHKCVTRAAGDADEYVRGAAEYLRLRLLGQYRPESPVFRFDLYTGGAQAGMTHRAPVAGVDPALHDRARAP